MANNPIRPDLMPSQCEGATDQSTVLDPVTGQQMRDENGNLIFEKIPSFANFAPRVSVIYDLSGTGQDVGPGELFALLSDQNHPGRQPRGLVHGDLALVGN